MGDSLPHFAQLTAGLLCLRAVSVFKTQVCILIYCAMPEFIGGRKSCRNCSISARPPPPRRGKSERAIMNQAVPQRDAVRRYTIHNEGISRHAPAHVYSSVTTPN